MSHRTKIIIACIAGSLGGLVIIGGIIFVIGMKNYNRIFVDTSTPQPTQAPQATPSPTPDPLAPFGVLVMGFGGGTHDGGYLTDTIILALVEQKKERVTLISLPRDLWINLPVTESETKGFKINAAYAIGRDDRRYPNKPEQYTGEGGGGTLAKYAISEITGLPVKHFVALSFDGFKKSIDVLGGVPVNVPVTFDDPLYPIEEKKNDTCGLTEEEFAERTATMSGAKLEESFACRYELLHFDRGIQTMDGETALKYVRSRHSPQHGGDYARSQRQKTLIAGVKEKVFTVGFLPKLIPFMNTLTYDMQMDIDPQTLQQWIAKADEFKGYEIRSIEVTEKTVLQQSTSADRQFILIPKTGDGDWQSVKDYIQSELEGIEASSEPTVNSTP